MSSDDVPVKRIRMVVPAVMETPVVHVSKSMTFLEIFPEKEEEENETTHPEPITKSDVRYFTFAEPAATTAKDPRKRVGSDRWHADDWLHNAPQQLALLVKLQANDYQPNRRDGDFAQQRLLVQHLTRKLGGYKQQDCAKGWWDPDQFVQLGDVVDALLNCQLRCRYCEQGVLALYDVALEARQWTVDRIDNARPHNRDNFHVACLECNVQRRRRTDDKFFQSKHLRLMKMDDSQGQDKQNG